MFLDSLEQKNPSLISEAIRLQQIGALPANCYVIDLDALADNAAAIVTKAQANNLIIYPMTKQFGRNPEAMRVLNQAGVDGFVAVDMACARAIKAAGYKIGNLGHLVQVPRHEIAEGIAMEPEYWTIFSRGQAQNISAVANASRPQKLLMRIYGPGDDIVDTHSGGFSITNLAADFAFLQALPNVTVAGVTTYPSASFERLPRVTEATHNVVTMNDAVSFMQSMGVSNPQINWPSEVCFDTIDLCVSGNATQIEPGHAFTGTSPYQIFSGTAPEKQAIIYLSEVSHLDRDDAFFYEATSAHFFGGGLYECIGAVEHTHEAIVGNTSGNTRVTMTLPPDGVIDFYGRLNLEPGHNIQPGMSVIICTRPQVFFTRAYVAAVSGISTGTSRVLGLWDSNGFPSAAAPVHVEKSPFLKSTASPEIS